MFFLALSVYPELSAALHVRAHSDTCKSNYALLHVNKLTTSEFGHEQMHKQREAHTEKTTTIPLLRIHTVGINLPIILSF